METAVAKMMGEKLLFRKAEGLLRKLQYENKLTDFSSNDYLGLSRSLVLKNLIQQAFQNHPLALSGATGSRLLSGNSEFTEQLEKEIAGYHQTENGLLFNSGYAANTSLFSCLPEKGDTVIYDEYIHASVIDGIRLSFAQRLKFKHNDLEDLKKKISQSTGNCYVAVESIYSMDGDFADLLSISMICQQYGAFLIVDEAHSFGVTGTGMVDELKIQSAVFARVITFGKALGLHGAIILGSDLLRDYLINFARPFIYSTAAPFHQTLSIQVAYRHLLAHPELSSQLQHKSSLLSTNLSSESKLLYSAIHCVFISGNQQAISFSEELKENGFDVRPIRSPAVPKGKERLRICVHLHNSDQEILALCDHIKEIRIKQLSIND